MSYKIGDIIEGVVTGVTSYGIFLSFGDNCSGLIHISEVSSSFVKDLNEYAKVDDKIIAKVVDIDEVGKYKLSIKQLADTKVRENISETESGFNTLHDKLDSWIKQTMDDFEKKS